MFFIYPKHAFGVHGPSILILTWKWHLPFGAVQDQHPNPLPACGEFQGRWEAGPHLEGRQLGGGLYFSGVSQCLKPRTLNLFREWCKAQGQSKVICCPDSQEPKACWAGPYRAGAVGTVLSRLPEMILPCLLFYPGHFLEHRSPASPSMLWTGWYPSNIFLFHWTLPALLWHFW